MDVILLERIESLGQMGEVVKVKPGFARNFLLPKKKALRATKENLSVFEKRRTQLEADNLKRREEAEKVSTKLNGLKITIVRQAAESGALYGSVTGGGYAWRDTTGAFVFRESATVSNGSCARPASLRNSRRRCSSAGTSAGSWPVPIQPSPSRAARRRAASPRHATRISKCSPSAIRSLRACATIACLATISS